MGIIDDLELKRKKKKKKKNKLSKLSIHPYPCIRKGRGMEKERIHGLLFYSMLMQLRIHTLSPLNSKENNTSSRSHLFFFLTFSKCYKYLAHPAGQQKKKSVFSSLTRVLCLLSFFSLQLHCFLC
ncbi:hypothetical protein HMI56_002456 [Coelomomyces lativittatus]|nr:hypothetical protein HMI56_002456 [Coelomomyces lativittatus]